MIKAFKFRAQAIFYLLEKAHPPGSQNLSLRNFFHYSTLGTVHYLWRGVAPKRKGLGKLNFE